MESTGQTEGGEALSAGSARWFAIWTQSHFEQLVHDQLTAVGFDAYLPTMRVWSRRAGKQRLIDVPMFAGYLFVRVAMDKQRHVEILKARGVVRILGGRWDELMPVPDVEIDSIRRVLDAGVTAEPYMHLREGQRVQIAHGPLAGVHGILVRTRPNRGLLVLSVDLLHQSVAIEVDCTAVIPSSSSSAGTHDHERHTGRSH
jgi:transcription antitermination factor NusG